MWPHNVPHNVECDIMAEHARKVCDSMNDAQAKDQLAALLSHLSQQISSGAQVGKPEPMYPNSQASTSNAGYGSSGQGQSSYGSGGSPSYGSNSGQGSGSGSRGSGGSGSGRGSDSCSGGGAGSGSGSGSRSDSRSGEGSGSGGSDGYCGDGSTGSEEDGSDSSGNDEAKNTQIQQGPSVKLPPGLVETSLPKLPMKVEVGNDRKIKNKAYQRTEAPTPTALPTPATAGAVPGLSLAVLLQPLESQAPALNQDCSPLAVLLQEVLLHAAKTFPPEDTIALCSTLANSLAGVLLRNVSAQPPQVPDTETIDPQTMYLLQQEIQRQQCQISSQFAASGFLPQVQNSMPFVAPDMPSYVTTEMLDTAHNVATNAAQQAAAAWQQQQASVEALAWEQEMLLQQANGFDASMARKPAVPVTSACPFPSDPATLAAFNSPNLPMGNNLNLPSYLRTDASGYTYPGHLGVPVPTSPFAGCDFNHCQYSCAPSVSNSNGGSVSGKGSGRSKVGDHKGLGKGKGKNIKAQDAPAAKRAGKGGSQKAEVGAVGGPPQIPGVQQEAFDKSLRSNLEALHSMDSNRIVLTRKINRLGFESASVLEAFFAKYGQVDRVLVSHCHAKSRNLRFRPAGLGFLVMSCAAEAEAILADGPELEVCPGATINVQPFKSFDEGMDERR